jgi:glycosyltransferase involved in cell wall biosynthesis
MEEQLISIVVSIYKGEKYLIDCIDSVLAQDYQNFEIIMVDDGSPDGSGKILDDYAVKDKRIKVLHKENSGVCNSRNIGIDMAMGNYICIIDQDDVLSPDYLSYFYNLIKDNDVEIATTPTADKFYKEIKYDIRNNDYVTVLTGEQTAIEMLYHKLIIAPWNKMISRNLIEKYHIRFVPEFFNGEGFAFSVECFQHASKVAIGHRNVYHYRVGDTESGASKFREYSIHSCIKAQQYIKNKLLSTSQETQKAWLFSNWHSHCDCLNMMVGCGVTKSYKSLYKSVKEVCKKDALLALLAPISIQQKIRGFLFFLNPFIASKIINYFRIRKFSKE